ncbi:uncharacterized protein PSFLO_01834 [Pseudozyma flocculosa]|uniref:Uncharacterized protein n=1 Tax=Pseudozyma flocculosa TaxID=84751 RepID=A0A5C3EVR7_9BASI|nr:uncharacterized protein PSFLO_01834 [Pseudozyma flocculosa]
MARRSTPATASARRNVAIPPIKFAQEDPQRRTTKKGGFWSSLSSFSLRVALFYTMHQQLAPVISPYAHKVQVAAEPYTKPAFDAVSPYAQRAWKVSRPYYRSAQRRGRLIYKKHIDPARKRAIKRAKAEADPYLRQVYAQYDRHVQPQVDSFQRHVRPYQDIYQRDVAPHVVLAYRYGVQSSHALYAFYVDAVHPHIVKALQLLHRFLVLHVDPALRRFLSIYVRPQVAKLVARLYEQKAHWIGSDAIKAAQAESSRLGRDADAQTKAAINAAEEAALKAQQDPSLMDKIRQAKDAVFAGDDGQDRVETAKLDAELDAEGARVEQQLEAWETEMGALIRREYALAVSRLIDLRNRAMADLPDRFGTTSETFVEDEVALVLSRIERGLRKLAKVEPAAARPAKGRALISQQLAKLDQSAEDTKRRIAAFHEDLLSQERQVVETSFQEIVRFADAAKKTYDGIMADCKFAATMDEWEGWDKGVRKRASLYLEDLGEVQRGERRVNADSGARDLDSEAPRLAPEIAALRKHAERLFSAARREVEKFGETGLSQLEGNGIIAKISDVADAVADQATNISLEAASGMLAAVALAREKLGLREPAATDGYFARARAYAQNTITSAKQAASDVTTSQAEAVDAVGKGAGSILGQVRSAGDKVASAAATSASSYANDVSGAVHHATRSAASVVGASFTPDSLADSAQGLRDSAASLASSIGDAAAAPAALHQATRSLGEVFGIEPTPEAPAEHVESVASRASSVASSIASAASNAVVDAQSFVVQAQPQETAASVLGAAASGASAVYVDLASAAGIPTRATAATDRLSSAATKVKSGVSAASASVSSLAHDASKVGVIAAGGTPRPDTLNEGADQIIALARDEVASGLNAAADAAAPIVSPISAKVVDSSSRFVDPAVETLKSAVHHATRSLQSAARATPSPEGAAERIEHAGKKVEEAFQDAMSRVRDEL